MKTKQTYRFAMLAMLLCVTFFTNHAMAQNADEEGTWHKAESKTLSEYLPDMISKLSNESTIQLVQVLSTINSITELSPERYEELKNTNPVDSIPSLESINKNVREIKESLEAQISESLRVAHLELEKSLRKQMREKGLDTLGSSKEDEDKVYHFTESGHISFTDAHGNIHDYSIATGVTTANYFSGEIPTDNQGLKSVQKAK